MPSDGSALVAEGVEKRYGAVTALAGVSLHVDPGECVAVVGASGSGKTTLLRLFNRTVVPDRGVVRVGGLAVDEGDPVGLRRSIGYVQQEGGLMPHWTAARNAALVPRLRGDADPEERGWAALERAGLDPAEVADRWPRQLSGGQRQRVAIARALAHEPDIILLDEPFGALDAITRAELQASFRVLIDDLGVTALLVTHDIREALYLGDRVAVMQAGRIEQIARPDVLLDEPATEYVERLLAGSRVVGR